MTNEQELEQEQVNPGVDKSTTEVDHKAEAAKYKAIAERRTKQLEKIKEAGQDEEEKPQPNKIKSEQGGTTIEHSYLFAQGLNIDEVKLVEKVAKNEGISLTDAYGDEYVQSRIKRDRSEAVAKKNTIGVSTGSPNAPREKTVKNMTEDEHQAYAEQLLKNATHK